jgi:serine/threonine protein kinase
VTVEIYRLSFESASKMGKNSNSLDLLLIILMLLLVLLRKYLQEDVIWVLLTQMLMALRECHHGKSGREDSKSSVAILHRDLKPDNGKLSGILMNRTACIKLW